MLPSANSFRHTTLSVSMKLRAMKARKGIQESTMPNEIVQINLSKQTINSIISINNPEIYSEREQNRTGRGRRAHQERTCPPCQQLSENAHHVLPHQHDIEHDHLYGYHGRGRGRGRDPTFLSDRQR